MRSVAGMAVERPIAFGGALAVMAQLAQPLVQLVTVAPGGHRGTVVEHGSEALLDATRRHEASVGTIVTESQVREFAAAGFELFEGRTASDRRPTAYRCQAFVCALPVHGAADLVELASRR
jgi:hypothetical protein